MAFRAVRFAMRHNDFMAASLPSLHAQDAHLSRRRLLAGGVAMVAAALPSTTRAWPSPPRFPVRLDITPNPAPVDAPFTFRVTGLTPGQRVTLRAMNVDRAQVPWTAEATFVATAAGEVDLATQAPASGSYTIADPMGLLWAATPPNAPATAPPVFYAPALEPSALIVTAEVAGAEVARVAVARTLLSPSTTVVDIAEDGLVGTFFLPSAAAPVPAVITLGGSEGGLYPRTAALLASHGFAALTLAYFAAGPPLPSSLAYIPLEYFGQAIAWLQARPGVRGDRLAVVGGSRGGELALLLGTIYPQLEAVVSYAGSGLVYPSPVNPQTPAWTYRGQPVPDLGDARTWNDAAIPVERINGPVLLISGEADQLWPSALLSQIAFDRLRAHAHPFADQHLRYPDAGHLIQPPYLPTTEELETLGGTAAGLARANADAWPRVLTLLSGRLLR
jgi:dienelactone hydrolase